MGADVQVLMATYNGERYVTTQLESVLTQTFQSFELLISDDRSDDATHDILQRLAAADKRAQLLDAGRRFGVARDHFLWLISQATAPYVAFCDQDDLWLSDKLETSMAKMHELEAAHGADTPLLVFSDLAVAAEDLAIISPSFVEYSGINPHRSDLPNLLVQNLAPGCTVLANRALYRDALRLPVDTHTVCMHDWWLMLTASALGHIGFVDQATMLYRQHGHNSVGAESESTLSILKRLGSYVDKLTPTSAQLDTVDIRLAQARAFAKTYADRLSGEDWLLCTSFGSLLEMSPLERVRWCHTHDALNATPLMQLGFDWELLLYDLGRRR